MGNNTRGQRPDTFGHSARIKERIKQYQKPGALAGLERQEAEIAAQLDNEQEPLPAVDLTPAGIKALREALGNVTDPASFFKTGVQWLKRPVALKVKTLSNGQYGKGWVKAVGIVLNGSNGNVGSIVLDVSRILAGPPVVVNRRVLTNPRAWQNLCAAPKRARDEQAAS